MTPRFLEAKLVDDGIVSPATGITAPVIMDILAQAVLNVIAKISASMRVKRK